MKPDLATLETTLTTATTEHEAATARLTKYEEQLSGVRATVKAHADTKAEHDAWRLDEARLGREPVVPDAKPEPTKPERERPSLEAIAAARALLDTERTNATIRKERAGQRAAATTRLEAATVDRQAAQHHHAYTEALLVAVRKAPGEILAAQVAALGDLGTMVIRPLEGDKGPCVEVLVRTGAGLVPWHDASSGEKRLADAGFRNALRVKLGVRYLPLVIDETNLYAHPGFTWPRFDGTVWRLVTADAPPGITVSAA
jgi:multidrug efflux pump subunit AcrA (membrane-fusion protein)